MPSRKPPSSPAWQVILEDIRSQSRATMEAVVTTRQVLEQRIDGLQEDTRSRFSQLEAAMQRIGDDSRARDAALGQRIDSLSEQTTSRFEEMDSRFEQMDSRLSRLESAVQRLGEDGRSRDASLELAVRDLKLSVQQNGADIRDLSGKLETLQRLEERVAALERRAT
jgi:chromosome segregation ATPase